MTRHLPCLILIVCACTADAGHSNAGIGGDTVPDTAPRAAVDAIDGRSVERDLTGDGRPEQLRLAVSGTEPADLDVVFTISSDGRELFAADWNSRLYFVYAGPIDSIPADSVRRRVRDQVSSFFADEEFGVVVVDQMLTPDNATELIALQLARAAALAALPDDMPEDEAELAALDRANAEKDGFREEAGAIWREMLEAALPTFSFFSGGEYNRTIAWSPSAGRFFSIWECC